MDDRYLELLSDFDLRILGAASELVPHDRAPAWFRARHERAAQAIGMYRTFDALIGPQESLANPTQVPLGPDGLQVAPSPFLFFSVLIARGAADIRNTALKAERFGSRTFRSVVEPPAGSITANDPGMRLYLAELLDSFSPARLPSRWEQILGRTSTRRIDEQNPSDLVDLLAMVDVTELPGVYRRLGDLALFRCGLTPHMPGEPIPTFDGRVWDEASLRHLISSLPVGLAEPAFDGQLPDLFVDWSTEQLLAELGPIWFRMAARKLAIPTMRGPLTAVADNFDDAVAFLHYLCTRYGLSKSDALVPSPGPAPR